MKKITTLLLALLLVLIMATPVIAGDKNSETDLTLDGTTNSFEQPEQSWWLWWK